MKEQGGSKRALKNVQTESHNIEQRAKRARTPRGVVLIGMLLIIGAFFSAGLVLVPTATLDQFNLPRSLLLSGAFVYGLLAYGLLRLRRWAWAAGLSFVAIHTFFLVQIGQIDNRVQYPALALLLAAAIYLLMPGVRARFLRHT